MPAPLTRLEFQLEDEVEDRPLTPETVDLPTLRGFLAEVETLIRGSVPGASLADSRVRIESGSVRVVAFVATVLAASLEEDLAKLARTGDLDLVQKPRAEVLERWQSRAQRSETRRYFVKGGGVAAPGLPITRETTLEHRGEDQWVAVERYVAGKVIDMGGKQTPNVHVLPEGAEETLTISGSEAQLAGKPHLYQKVTLRIVAEEHLETRALRGARLLEFIPLSREVDEGALARLWQKGRTAWQDVSSATAWVEEARGNL